MIEREPRPGSPRAQGRASSSDLVIGEELPSTPAARTCLAAYFGELERRFDEGCDLKSGGPAILDEMTPPRGTFFVARRGAEAVGCVGLKLLTGDTAELKRMWAAPSARGQGLAALMLAAAEAKARDLGRTRMVLDTNRALTEAQAFYRRQGYVEIERYNDNPYAHHWYEKRL